MKFIAEKLQHLKRITLYISHGANNPPNIQLTNKEVLLVDTDHDALLHHISEIVPADDRDDLSIRYVNRLEEDGLKSWYEFTLMEFDCAVDAEEAAISGSGEDYIVITIPIDEDKTAQMSILTESDAFPTSYELDRANYSHGIHTRCCKRSIFRPSVTEPVRSVHPLPSPYWQELCDIWFCHNRKASVVTAEKHDVDTRPGRLLVGDGFILLHHTDLRPIHTKTQTHFPPNASTPRPTPIPAQATFILEGLPRPLREISGESVFHSYMAAVQSPLLALVASDRESSLGSTAVAKALERVKAKMQYMLEEHRSRQAEKEGQGDSGGEGDGNVGVSADGQSDKEIAEKASTQTCGGHESGNSGTAENSGTENSGESSQRSLDTLETLWSLSQRLPIREFFPLFCDCGALIGECEIMIQENESDEEIPNEKSETCVDPEKSSEATMEDEVRRLLSRVRAVPTGTVKFYKHALSTAECDDNGEVILATSNQANDQQQQQHTTDANVNPNTAIRIAMASEDRATDAAPASDSSSLSSSSSTVSTSSSSPQPLRTGEFHSQLVHTQLPRSFNVFFPYLCESLISSTLLSAGHAHVGYRFSISDGEGRGCLQLMLLNWDVYIKAEGAPLHALRRDALAFAVKERQQAAKEAAKRQNDPSHHDTNSTITATTPAPYSCTSAHEAPVYDPRPIPTAKDMVPAVKLLYRYSDFDPTQAHTPGSLPMVWAGWTQIMGAQCMTWPRALLEHVCAVLRYRNGMVPRAVRNMGAAKGFEVSFLLRMSTLPCAELPQ